MSEEPNTNDKNNEQKNQDKGTIWNPAILTLLLPFLDTIATKLAQYLDKKYARGNEYVETTARHDRRIIIILLSFLGAVIAGLYWLTWAGNVSGEALLFAIGLIIGYVFAIIQRFIFGSQRSVVESSEE